jgi:hypothetical protein
MKLHSDPVVDSWNVANTATIQRVRLLGDIHFSSATVKLPDIQTAKVIWIERITLDGRDICFMYVLWHGEGTVR